MKIAESRVSPKNTTTVPSAVRKALNLKAGDVIEWHVEEEKIVIKKKSQ
ncbi:MAG: AbrB/MazE/SpoVT family DNA-binding domain-containing protein [Candidatus Odinarchaeota archaeon]|mgnify:CR=1 FL=1|nr:AbrB/MazE/SpoVT family DNA-binding domain-containing protein [Candidatus Odinarchaeota archaeon]